jgi:hypothetical protein
MPEPTLVAATSLHGGPVAVALAAWKGVRACQNLILASGAVMVASDWDTFPESHIPAIPHPL